jgi:hypothetical protein
MNMNIQEFTDITAKLADLTKRVETLEAAHRPKATVPVESQPRVTTLGPPRPPPGPSDDEVGQPLPTVDVVISTQVGTGAAEKARRRPWSATRCSLKFLGGKFFQRVEQTVSTLLVWFIGFLVALCASVVARRPSISRRPMGHTLALEASRVLAPRDAGFDADQRKRKYEGLAFAPAPPLRGMQPK